MSNIAWIPCNKELCSNRLFDITSTRDGAIERFVVANNMLIENGHKSNTIDLCVIESTDVVLFYNILGDIQWLIKVIKVNSNVRLINIPIEPPVVSPLHSELILSLMPFDRILVSIVLLFRFQKSFAMVKNKVGLL